jgi:hypothetical protein
MTKIRQLKKQIEQCSYELDQDYLRYDKSKQRFVTDIKDLKQYLPAISVAMVISALILTFSKRARSVVGKINKNLLLITVNARLVISTVTMLIRSIQHANRLIETSRSQHPQ